MKTVISFAHDDHPIPASEGSEPPGRDVIRLLMKALEVDGAQIVERSPVSGEGGWSAWFSKAGRGYKLFVNTAGLGKPMRDYWVATFMPTGRGLLGMLSREDAHLENILRTLRVTLDRDGSFVDTRWWQADAIVAEIMEPGTSGEAL